MKEIEKSISYVLDELRTSLSLSESIAEIVRMANYVYETEEKQFSEKKAKKILNDPETNIKWGLNGFCRLSVDQQKTIFDIFSSIDFKESCDLILGLLTNQRGYSGISVINKDVLAKVFDGVKKKSSILIPNGLDIVFAVPFLKKLNPKKLTIFTIVTGNEYLLKYLYRDFNCTVIVGNILSHLKTIKEHDHLVVLGPWGMRAKGSGWDSKEFNYPMPGGATTIEHLISYALENGKNGLKVSTLLPAGVMFTKTGAGIRDHIKHLARLDEVFELSKGALRPYTNIQAYIFQLQKDIDSKDSYPIKLAKEDKQNEKTISIDSSRFFGSENWSMHLHELETQNQPQISIEGPSNELEHMVEIFRGPPVKKVKKGESLKIKMVKNKDLESNKIGAKDVGEEMIKTTRPLKRYYLEDGDILVVCRGNSISMSIIENVGGEEIIATQNIAIIRADRTKIVPEFLYIFLQSPLGQRELLARQTGSTMIVLSVKDLNSIKAPYLSSEMQNDLVKRWFEADKKRENDLKKVEDKFNKDQETIYRKMGIQINSK